MVSKDTSMSESLNVFAKNRRKEVISSKCCGSFLCDNIISQPNHLKKSKLNVGIPTSSHVVLTTEEDGKVDQRGCTSPEGVSIYKVMYSKVR